GTHGVLSNEERRALRVLLERIADPAMWAGIVGTFAMGVQNAHPRVIARAGGVPNTVMTGNVTQAILDAVDMLSPGTADSARATARARFAKMLPAIVAFALGAACGALGFRA
ncbi:DUF1275 domain-containing protein, partial [Enterobacter sp. DRP3]|nr:DUF1275 domain-containing protein [Enterobacter sp. DRP3]